jgi:hypothetical protein
VYSNYSENELSSPAPMLTLGARLSQFMRRLTTMMCSHEYIYKTTTSRMYLQCMKCEHMTSGWSIDRGQR